MVLGGYLFILMSVIEVNFFSEIDTKKNKALFYPLKKKFLNIYFITSFNGSQIVSQSYLPNQSGFAAFTCALVRKVPSVQKIIMNSLKSQLFLMQKQIKHYLCVCQFGMEGVV